MLKRVTCLMIVLTLCISFILSGCNNTEKNTVKEDQTTTEDQKAEDQETKESDSQKVEDAEKEPVELSVMYPNGGDQDMYSKWMDNNIKEFTEKNPNVKIEALASLTGDPYLTKLNTLMAANEMPDVFMGWTLARLEPFAKSNRLYEIGQDIEKDKEFKDFLNLEALKSTTYDGKIYAIPSTIFAEYINYNKKVFDKLGLKEPETYEDFLDIINVCKENDVIPIMLCNKETWQGTIPYMIVLDRVGGMDAYENTVVNKTGKWTDEPFVKSAEILQEWVNIGAFEKGVNGIPFPDAEAKFVEGKGAMWFLGSLLIPLLDDKLGKDGHGMFNLPVTPGGKGSQNNWISLPNNSICISQSCSNKEEAVELVKCMFSQERQAELAEFGFIPCTKVKTDSEKVSPAITELINELANAENTIYPWDVPMGNFLGAELNKTTPLFYEGVDPQKALEGLQKAAESENKE